VKTYGVGSPAKVPLDGLITQRGKYYPEKERWLDAMYPMVVGYKGKPAIGTRANDPALIATILEYWRILNQTVLSAERRMIERTNGERLDREAASDHERLDQLAALERDLDHATLRTLKKILPFSRNDLWEIAELRQQLHRK
jgi:hypothetical protein